MSKRFFFKPGDLVRPRAHGFKRQRMIVGKSVRAKNGQVKVYMANYSDYWTWQSALELVKPAYRKWIHAGGGYFELERQQERMPRPMGMDAVIKYLNKLEKEVANYRELIKGAPKEHFRQEYGA